MLPKSSNNERIKSSFRLIDSNEEELTAVNNTAEGRHYRFVNPKDMLGYDVWPEESS